MSIAHSETETWRVHLATYRSLDLELFDEVFLSRWGNREWNPGDADRRAADFLHIHITSRISTQPLPNLEGIETAVLDSIFELFGTARAAAEKNFGASHFDTLIWHVFNTFVRPFAAKWHRRIQEGTLAALDVKDEFRAEFAAPQRVLVRLDELLLDLRDGNRPPPAVTYPSGANARAVW
jgi:hypothetical protein